MPRLLIHNEDAVNIEIGYILNLFILLVFTGAIVTAFNLYSDHSSQKAMRAGFADLGSQIARDTMNIYDASIQSHGNFSSNISRDIPLTIGGSGYIIEILKSSETHGLAVVRISDGGYFNTYAETTLNSINTTDSGMGGNVNISDSCKLVPSGSGVLKIQMRKNTDGRRELCIR